MRISATDTRVTIEDGEKVLTLLEKPEFPDYSNVTTRPYITFYYMEDESVWDRLRLDMLRLMEYCPENPYLGCYALVFRRLYPVLLSTSQAKNVMGYGEPSGCGAYKIFQDFMTFLQKGNALTALAVSPFSLMAAANGSCVSLLYRLDTCPTLTAVCDAIEKVRPGGLILLYTIKNALPAELAAFCGQAETDRFGSCTVYALTMDAALAEFASRHSSEAFILSRREALLQRTKDLQGLIQAMLAGAALPEDAYLIAVSVLQQIEEILLSLYDYLENDELPVLANALKEAVLNCCAGVKKSCDLSTYISKLTQASEVFYAAIGAEF